MLDGCNQYTCPLLCSWGLHRTKYEFPSKSDELESYIPKNTYIVTRAPHAGANTWLLFLSPKREIRAILAKMHLEYLSNLLV